MTRADAFSLGGTAAAMAAAGVLTYAARGSVLTFIAAAVALSLLAMLVGRATESAGAVLSPGVTGVMQAALGNLPELFVCIFSLRAGYLKVVQGAIVGSILANSLLVLGMAILVGGIKHGKQRFHAPMARMTM